MLALINKCIAHNLEELALKESRQLKKRLDRLCDCEEGTGVSTIHLIRFETQEPPSGPILSLLVNHQMSVLRLFGLSRRPSLIEGVLPLLDPALPLSPTSLLLRQGQVSFMKTKSGQQLEGLARLLFHLAGTFASDARLQQNKAALKPACTLRLQWLALTTRIGWWGLCGHNPDVEKDVWVPFSKCLATFLRTAPGDRKGEYKLSLHFYNEITTSVDVYKNSGAEECAARISLFKTLSSLADLAGDITAAVDWAVKAQRWCVQSRASYVMLAIFSVRVASLQLRNLSANSARLLEHAVRCLNCSLKGESREVDELLLETSTLRKTISQVTIQEASSDLTPVLFEGTFACVKLLVRYLGQPPPPDADAEKHLVYGERLAVARPIIRPFIETAFQQTKHLFSQTDTKLESFDGLLQYVCTLVSWLRASNDTQTEGIMQELGLPVVKVSNLYLAYHNLRTRVAGRSDDQAIKALQKSVEALRGSGVEEKSAGLFTMKLEKLGEVYQKAEYFHQAYESLEEAMGEYAAKGALRQAAEMARFNPLRLVFGSGSLADVRRIAKSIHQLKTKLYSGPNEVEAAINVSNLPDQERAVLFEMQLGLWFHSLLKTSTLNSRQAAEVETILAFLLDVYVPSRYPIRLQRIAVVALQMASEYPKLFLEDQLDQLKAALTMESAMQSLGEDVGLAAFKQSITSSLRVVVALQEKPVDTHSLKAALYSWQSIVDARGTGKPILSGVDDPNMFIKVLRSVADFFEFQGLHSLAAPTLALLNKLLAMSESVESPDVCPVLLKAGLQLVRMGYSGKSGHALAKAEHFLQTTKLPTDIKLEYYLAYAEYLLSIGSTAKCGQTLEESSALARAQKDFAEGGRGANSLMKTRFSSLLAKAFQIYSRYCMEIGSLDHAFDYARRAVKLTQHLWTETENRGKLMTQASQPASNNNDTEMEKLACGMSSLMNRSTAGTPVIISHTHDALSGPAFWLLAPDLIDSTCQLASVFAHCGQFQEAQFHVEKALQIAEATGCQQSRLAILTQTAELHVRAGRVDKAQPLLDAATEISSKVEDSIQLVRYQHVLSKWRGASKQAGTIDALNEAINCLDRLAGRPEALLTRFTTEEDQLVEKASELRIDSEPRLKRTTRAQSAKKKQSKQAIKPTGTRKVKASSSDSLDTPATTTECIPLRSLQGIMLTEKSVLFSRQDAIAAATESLKVATAYQYSNQAVIQQSIAKFRIALASAMKEMASDFTFNVLPESTLSLPAVKVESKLHGKGVLVTSPHHGAVLSQSPSPRKRGRPKATSKPSGLASLLREARDSLFGIQALALRTSNNAIVEAVNSLLASISVTLSAAYPGCGANSIQPLTTALNLDLPKIYSQNRLRSICRIENTHLPRDQLLRWPDVDDETSFALTANDFQRDFIDIIPESWTAISITLSDAKEDLLLTRYRPGQSPFILRLPLTRQHTRDADEDVFGYTQGMIELREIIDLAIFSAQSSKSVTTKAGKLEWWEGREALDRRLADLLSNIENIWLGGFRGILAQQDIQSSLLAGFQKSFQTILDRHLPSRRGRGTQKPTSLDPRILELFTGLGDPADESLDLDEALVDLLYFVVDVLQFNGERNAYDEVDFDSMVIETIDAITAYHASKSGLASDQHTILILDKHLHGIPWESLPSLSNRSITRLSSLAALRTRILDMQSSALAASACDAPGFRVPRTSGHSILNPSGDLANTQSIMSPHLTTLPPAWTHTTAVPTESQLSTTLSSTPLLLYFGHGSGSQYIRPRAVKKLPRCATTWLMGCSSAAITDNGDFEPSGMVLAYLAAGALAVVGTLWDVTDRDCDRASVDIGARWGLWKEQVHVMAKYKAARGRRCMEVARSAGSTAPAKLPRAKKHQRGEGGEGDPMPVGLPEAVARGRQACHLKYLNGAAFVVYGIPVYLTE